MKMGIIFDVDGTLWDAAPQVARSWSEVLKKYPEAGDGRQVTARDMYENMGKTMTEFGDALFPDLPPALREKIMEDCMAYENRYLEKDPGTLYPDVQEVLRQLGWKYELFIVSNCQSGYIEVLMSACGLTEYIKDIECFGNTGFPKSDNIRMVIQRNHLDKCFYVGDTAMDGTAAAMAGIPFVHAAYGYGQAEEAAARINSFRELLTVARNLLDDSLP